MIRNTARHFVEMLDSPWRGLSTLCMSAHHSAVKPLIVYDANIDLKLDNASAVIPLGPLELSLPKAHAHRPARPTPR